MFFFGGAICNMTSYQDYDENVVVYGSRVGIQVHDKSYVQADRHDPYAVSAGRPTIDSWEVFTVVPAINWCDAWGLCVCDGDWIALKTCRGFYVMADHRRQVSGEMRAYEYTKSINEWEKFQVRLCVTEITGKPLQYNTPFFLKAENGAYITLKNQRLGAFSNQGRHDYTIGESLRFVDPRFEALDYLRVVIHKAQEEIVQDQADIKKQKAEIQRQAEQMVRQTRKLAEETAIREQDIEHQEKEIQIEHDGLFEWAQDLERQQSELQLIQTLHEEWEKDRLQRDEYKLKEISDGSGLIADTLIQLIERQNRIVAAEDELKSLRVKSEKVRRSLAKMPALGKLEELSEELSASIETLEAQCKKLQDQEKDCDRLRVQKHNLEENIERLLLLAQHLPALREQFKSLEDRLGASGHQAAQLEEAMEPLITRLVNLQDAALETLKEETRHSLFKLERQEEELKNAEKQMRENEARYATASALYEERLPILKLYEKSKSSGGKRP